MPKAPTQQERRHLRAVASLGCIVCRNRNFGVTPLELTAIHHTRFSVGAAQRSSHYLALPLCAAHHQTGGYGVAFHAGQGVWEAKFGSELVLLIQVYTMLERAGDFNLLPSNGGCGCEFCRGGWRELLGVSDGVE